MAVSFVANSAVALHSGLLNRQNQKPVHSSCSWKLWKHVLNLNWAALLSEQVSKPQKARGRQDRTVQCFVFPHTNLSEKWKQAWNQAIESENKAGWRLLQTFLFCFVSDVYTCCLSWLTTSAASATTAYWLNDGIYSTSSAARTAGVCLQDGFCYLFSFGGIGGRRVNTSFVKLHNRECISFLHLMASNISPNGLKLRNTLCFNFSYHFHFSYFIFYCVHISIHFR